MPIKTKIDKLLKHINLLDDIAKLVILASQNEDISKYASQLINSNPARPRKDLITPELKKGNRKLTEGIKVNKDTLDQVEKKPRIPMAKIGETPESNYNRDLKAKSDKLMGVAKKRTALGVGVGSLTAPLAKSKKAKIIGYGGAALLGLSALGNVSNSNSIKEHMAGIKWEKSRKGGYKKMDKHASNMEMFFKLGFKKELEKNGGWRETFGKRVVGVGERLALAAKRAKLRAKSLRGKFTQGATDLKGKIRDALAAKRAKSLRGKFTQGATDLKGKIRDAAKRRLNETRATSAARS